MCIPRSPTGTLERAEDTAGGAGRGVIVIIRHGISSLPIVISQRMVMC